MESTILIIDDDADARGVVSSALSILGLKCIEAPDGKAGFAKFLSERPALVILDVMMPGENGNHVCKRIKGDVSGEYTPVLMLTARDSVREKVDALDGGADDYLTKPFHYQELQARVKALLRVRDLNLTLRAKNEELRATQEKLIQKERQLLVVELAGATAHKLGQPLSAILLNCHLIEKLPTDNPSHQKAMQAIKADVRLMAELIEKLRAADARRTEPYFGAGTILDLEKSRESKE